MVIDLRSGGVGAEGAHPHHPRSCVLPRWVEGRPGSVGPAALISGRVAAAQQAIDERLGDGAFLYVERGYDTAGFWVFVLIGGVFGLLVLVATLTSTAMSNAESRADSATLASLGAPPSLRQRLWPRSPREAASR